MTSGLFLKNKVEFEFYCAMIARLAYEYFLKELGGGHYRHQDGDKTTLQKMRNLLLEKRNFTLEQDSRNNFVITFLDSGGNDLENQVASMLVKRMEQGKNKVLWWNNRGLILKFKNQYESRVKCPAEVTEKCPESKGRIV